MKKRLLCVLLVLAVLLVPGTVSAMAEPPAASPIALGGSAKAVIANGGDIAYFSFTPAESGRYSFYSTGDMDTYGHLYDANMNQLTYNDDGGQGRNFEIQYNMTAGVTYYFGARYYSSGTTGEFDVFLDIAHYLELKAENNENRLYVGYGLSATLRTVATSYPAAEITYEWYQNDSSGHSTKIDGATGSSYTIASVTAPTTYLCVASNGEKTASLYFYVYVDNELTAEADGSASVTVSPGASATLKVKASCKNGTLSYTWRDNSGTVVSEEGPTFTTPALNARTSFQCTVTDQYGNSRTVYFTCNIDNEFTAEADGPTDITVSPGASATLKVKASCKSGTLSYTWRDDDYTVVSEDGPTYTTPALNASSSFQCNIRDQYGNSRTIYFSCEIDNELMAEAVGSTNVTVSPGASATLKVSASCKSGTLSYTWRDNSYTVVSEAGPTYTTPALNARSSFQCTVTDQYGNSRTVYFTCLINNSLVASTDGPSQLVVKAGDPVTLKVNASCASGELTYTWYRDSTWPESNKLPGEVGPTLHIASLDRYQQYVCVVKDQYGNSSTVYFYCTVANELSANPVSARKHTLAPGQSVTLEIEASCRIGELTYEWAAHTQEDYEAVEISAAGTSATLTNLQKSCDAYCTVTDVYGNRASVYFEIEVDNQLRASAENGAVTVAPGETATLTVTASCLAGSLHYQWYRLTYTSKTSYNITSIQGQTQASITLNHVTQAGTYRCRVYDQYGTQREVDFTLTVDNGFSVRASGASAFTVAPKDSVTAKVAAGCRTGSVTYMWYFQRASSGVYYSPELLDGAGASYTLRNVENSGTLSCVAHDEYGNSGTVDFAVTVDNELKAERVGEARLRVARGGSVTMSVNASCKTGSIYYRWEKGVPYGPNSWSAVDITGAEDSSYELTNVQKAGRYWCRVYDEYGNSASVYFDVEIINEFTASALSKPFVKLGRGKTATLSVTGSSTAGEVNYQWYEGDAFAIVGETGSSLTVGAERRGALYTCLVSDQFENKRTFSFYCIYDSAEPIAVGEMKVASINAQGGVSVFGFTPEKTGVYRFFSEDAGRYTAVHLLDARLNELDYAYSSPNYDFSYEATLTAGTQYYFAARYSSASYVGGFPVGLTMESEIGEIELQLPLIKGQKVYLPSDLYGKADSVTVEGSCVTKGKNYLLTAASAGEGSVTVAYGDLKVIYHVTVVNSAEILKLPAALTEIESQAFFGDSAVSYVELADSVSKVGAQAFADSGLKQIVVKGSDTAFASDAFSGTGAVILCSRGSAAASFAEKQGITYVYTNA